VSIIFHFPETVKEEFQEKYRNKIKWNKDNRLLKKFKEGKTGYPIVDACIRQLLEEGWMHNRGMFKPINLNYNCNLLV
jgi:deoxyribodipyrimidine photo-lyase